MFPSVMTTKGHASKDEAKRVIDQILPRAQSLPGFKGVLFLLDEKAGKSDELPMFLTVRDLQSLLQVSRSEAYVIAHRIGASRIGRRLGRVPREAFLRWRAERVAEAEADWSYSRGPFQRIYRSGGGFQAS